MKLTRILVCSALVLSGLVLMEAPASATPRATESFTATSDINNSGGPVVASGVIDDTGQDIVVSDTEDTFVFPDGQITVFHSPTSSHNRFNEKKCTFSFTERGTYVFGNGTGAWAGYNGSGKYVARGSATNACDTPVGSVEISAHGRINAPDQTAP